MVEMRAARLARAFGQGNQLNFVAPGIPRLTFHQPQLERIEHSVLIVHGTLRERMIFLPDLAKHGWLWNPKQQLQVYDSFGGSGWVWVTASDVPTVTGVQEILTSS